MADKPSMTEALTSGYHNVSDRGDGCIFGVFLVLIFLPVLIFLLYIATAGAYGVWNVLQGLDISEGIPGEIFFFLSGRPFSGRSVWHV